MLPFQKIKKSSGIAGTIHRKPDHEENHEDSGLEAVASDLLDGIQSSDKSLIISALRAAFQILDSEPHEEGPHTNEQE